MERADIVKNLDFNLNINCLILSKPNYLAFLSLYPNIQNREIIMYLALLHQ